MERLPVKYALVAATTAWMLFLPGMVLAQNAADTIGLQYADDIGLPRGESDPLIFLTQLIEYLLTFLGIIAVIVIIWNGLRWMLSFGDEDRVSGAKSGLVAGIIGLVVILAAYAIVTFIVGTTEDVLEGSISGGLNRGLIDGGL